MKRALDVVASLLALLLLGPVLIVAAALIAITLGRPVMFAQERPGRHDRIFTLYKFRSMTMERDAAGELLPNADRVTRLGRFLRKSSMDELPSLLNVLKGEMSLVGPRPLKVDYLPLYNEHQARRHEVRPGITGWAQINGRNQVSWEKRFDMDVWYVDNQSFWLDLKILFLTVVKVFRSEGVDHTVNEVAGRFTGNKEPR
ncbi:MAG: sugar transferase [Pseudomonadota bacterium]